MRTPFVQTPDAMLTLIEEGLVSSSEIKSLFMSSRIPKLVNSGSVLLTAMYSISKYIENLRGENPAVVNKAIQIIREFIHNTKIQNNAHKQLSWAIPSWAQE